MERETGHDYGYEEYARKARIEREIAARVVASTGLPSSWRHLTRELYGIEEIMWQQPQSASTESDDGSDPSSVRGGLQVMNGVFPMNTGY